ncbi:MAG: hypothetical protein R6U61_02245 [Thermoplasmata archaeon]
MFDYGLLSGIKNVDLKNTFEPTTLSEHFSRLITGAIAIVVWLVMAHFPFITAENSFGSTIRVSFLKILKNGIFWNETSNVYRYGIYPYKIYYEATAFSVVLFLFLLIVVFLIVGYLFESLKNIITKREIKFNFKSITKFLSVGSITILLWFSLAHLPLIPLRGYDGKIYSIGTFIEAISTISFSNGAWGIPYHYYSLSRFYPDPWACTLFAFSFIPLFFLINKITNRITDKNKKMRIDEE